VISGTASRVAYEKHKSMRLVQYLGSGGTQSKWQDDLLRCLSKKADGPCCDGPCCKLAPMGLGLWYYNTTSKVSNIGGVASEMNM